MMKREDDWLSFSGLEDHMPEGIHPGQLDGAPTPDGLAVPDQLVANGERPRALLAESGYPGLVMAESVRYLGLRAALAAAVCPSESDRLRR